MVDLIRRLELDAFGAQEVRRNQARYIRKQLPEFAYVGDFREKDSVHGEASPAGPWRTYTRRCWRAKEVPAVEALKFPSEYRNPPRVGSPNDGKVDVKMYCGQHHCGPRIDFIYVSPGIKVKSYATHADPRPGMEYYPSDHFPVTAEIEL